jgi:hypothetical protein
MTRTSSGSNNEFTGRIMEEILPTVRNFTVRGRRGFMRSKIIA